MTLSDNVVLVEDVTEKMPVIELVKNRLSDFPFLILKIDEHTGEAGFNTRIEAFVDMLERR